MSSPNELSLEALDHLNVEIIDHLKRSGIYDEIRVGLMDPIWSDSCFQDDIVVRFIGECEKFCEQVDLSQSRGALRTRLAAKFEQNYSTSGRLVRSHIEKILNQRNEDVKSKYYQHAKAYIQKFIPSDDDPGKLESDSEVQADIDMDIDTEDDDIERPVYSPIGNDDILIDNMNSGSIKEDSPINHTHGYNANNTSEPSLEDIPIPPEDSANETQIEVQEDSAKEPKHVDDAAQSKLDLEDISLSPPVEDHSDELERLTFSSVSSVNTNDLSDFDNSIKLSDDEASIVGKPRNSKVPLPIIQGQINDLQTSNTQSNNARRNTRARKSNSRYSSEHFKLF